MRYPNPAMLLYIGIGDAYASAVEYVKLPERQGLVDEVLKFERYHRHPTFGLDAGMYTDDTEMSVANASVLLDYKPPYMPLMFAKAWVREFARGGRRKGYSKAFQKFLEYIESGEEFLLNIDSNSNKNGAAMRSVPLGVLHSVSEVIDAATIQAMITHDTPEGLFSSRAVAMMSHFALYESSWLGKGLREYCLDNLPKWDIQRFGYVFKQLWSVEPVRETRTRSVAVATVHAVVTALDHSSNHPMLSMLEKIIRWGGDTDSVAAIAMGIASCRARVNGDAMLPEFMIVDLEDGNPHTGALYLLNKGNRLMNKFKV